MDFSDLNRDRFLAKDPSQNDQTKDAAYNAVNPAQQQGKYDPTKTARPRGSEDGNAAPNILTNTVIVSCFIQTSALPSRIEMQGNDITFFDDTTMQNGQVIGDTSRLIFTHASGKKGDVISEGFILEKRASKFSTYDNVLALYALPSATSKQNILYIGRDGTGDTIRLNYVELTVNHQSNPGTEGFPNGMFAIGGALDGIKASVANFEVVHNSIIGLSSAGYSVIIRGTGGGAVFFPNGLSISASGIRWVSGAGSPNGVVTAPIGSLYSNTSGGSGTTLYVKESGSGSSGWVGK